MDSLPAELVEGVVHHLTLQERLVLRKASRRMNSLVSPLIFALSPPLRPHFATLKLHKLSGVLHVSSRSVDLPTAQHFVPMMDHALRTWRRRVGDGKIDCFATFDFPPVSVISLFASATIDHLDIAQFLPVYLDDGMLRQLQQLLTGCSIDKATLVFDHQSLRILPFVPSFLRSLSVRHVQFVLERADTYNMMTPFADASLSAALVAAGIEEVSLVISSGYGRQQPDNLSGSCGYDTDDRVMRVISALYKAGVKSIAVDKFTLNRSEDGMEALDRIIEEVTRLSISPLSLHLYLTFPIENLRVGRYSMPHDDEYKRIIKVTREDASFVQKISIEIGVDDVDST